MSQTTTPIPLICIGKHRHHAVNFEKSLAPNFVYPAIVTAYNKDALLTLLETLNPSPRGIAVGGGYRPEDQEGIQQVAADWAKGKGVERLPIVIVPGGTYEREGPEGVVSLLRRELGEAFGISWEAQQNGEMR